MSRLHGVRSWSRPRKLVAVIAAVVVCNLVVRGIWVAFFQARPVSDFAVYFGTAERWASGQGFTLDGTNATVAWPPGWPFVLRVLFEFTGPSIQAGLILQVVLSSLVAGLVVLLGYKAFSSLRVALLAGVFFTVQPASWARDSLFGTEPLFTLLLVGGLFSLIVLPGKRGAALTGALWALGSLVRGTLLFGFPLIGLVALARGLGWRKALLNTAVGLAAILVVLAPWTIRNYQMTGAVVPISSNLGQNLWQGTQGDVGYWWSNDPKQNPVLRAKSEIENDRIGREAAFEYWREHPVEFLVRAPVKITGLYAGNSEVFFWLRETGEMTKPIAARWTAFADLAYWTVMGLALVGSILLWRRGRGRPRAVFTALVGMVVYTTLVFTWFLTWDRFRDPLMPIFCLLAAYGVVTLARVRLPR